MSDSSFVQLRPCWSCKGPVKAGALFCPTCAALQPPGVFDPFLLFALSPRYDLEEKTLEQRYLALQRQTHPDRFAARSAKERAFSQSWTANLNEAREILRDPVRRAVCLLSLNGRVLDINSAGTIKEPALLMEAMEQREALEAANSPEDVSLVRKQADARIVACKERLKAAFEMQDFDKAERLTIELRYLLRLAEEAKTRHMKLVARSV